jgi:hypothetical protein
MYTEAGAFHRSYEQRRKAMSGPRQSPEFMSWSDLRAHPALRYSYEGLKLNNGERDFNEPLDKRYKEDLANEHHNQLIIWFQQVRL